MNEWKAWVPHWTQCRKWIDFPNDDCSGWWTRVYFAIGQTDAEMLTDFCWPVMLAVGHQVDYIAIDVLTFYIHAFNNRTMGFFFTAISFDGQAVICKHCPPKLIIF